MAGLGPVSEPAPAAGESDRAGSAAPGWGERLLEYTALGSLGGAAVGTAGALRMEPGIDMLLCLIGSIGATALICYTYFSKD
jgi:hypothetical protein